MHLNAKATEVIYLPPLSTSKKVPKLITNNFKNAQNTFYFDISS